MATYLELCQQVLFELNEANISTVTASSGFTQYVIDTVNRSMREIDSEERGEWPWNYNSGSTTTQAGTADYDYASTQVRSVDKESFILEPTDVVTNGTFDSAVTGWTSNSAGGTAAYSNTSGYGRLGLTPSAATSTGAAAMYQALSVTAGEKYRVYTQVFNDDIVLTVGTTAAGSDILTKTLTLDNKGDGKFFDSTFESTSTTVYLQYSASASTELSEVDSVVCVEDFKPVSLKVTSLDEWRKRYSQNETLSSPAAHGRPQRVVLTQNRKFKLSPPPDKNTYKIRYDYWAETTDLSTNASIPAIYGQYHDVIVDRTLYHVHLMRSDYEAADRIKKRYEDRINDMRSEVVTDEEDYMYTSDLNVNITYSGV